MNTNELFIYGHELPKQLTEDELRNLIKQVNDGSKEARDEIIIHNIKLVLYEVTSKFKKVDYDKKDLVSIGNLGLLKAIDTYDLSKGVKFSVYAIRCIDNEILMFLRKLKKDKNVDSIDRVAFYDKDGSEFKLEDQLSDDRDLIEENENTETHKIVREIVNDLPDRDREIIMLYFGFYNDQIYTQKQISDKMSLSQSYVSRLINKIVKQIGEILKTKGVIELSNPTGERKPIEKKEKIQKNVLTPETIISEITPVQLEKVEKSEPVEEGLIEPTISNSEKMTKEDYIRVLELLRTPSFAQMMSTLSVREAVIISLKLGYIDGKYFSTESISEFLGIEPSEVIEITKKILSLYKDDINHFLDNAIPRVKDESRKGKK